MEVRRASTFAQLRRYRGHEVALQSFVNSRPVQMFIIVLVGCYTLLIFIIIALDDLLSE